MQVLASEKHVCVGLDPDPDRFSSSVAGDDPPEKMLAFNRSIIDSTIDLVAAYKPNSAFYERFGSAGLECLKETVRYIRTKKSDTIVIIDVKRGDIATTNVGYAEYVFDWLGGDALTAHPYLGRDALKPFLDRPDRGTFLVVRTLNKDANTFQALDLDGVPMFIYIAQEVAAWDEHSNLGLVISATSPEEVLAINLAAPRLPLLIPGYGAQGGEIGSIALALKKPHTTTMAMFSASRSVIYASAGADYARAARMAVVDMNSLIHT